MRTLIWSSKTGCVSARRLYDYIKRYKPSRERLLFRCRDPIPSKSIDTIVNYGRRGVRSSYLYSPDYINGYLPRNKFNELELLLPRVDDGTDGRVITPNFSRVLGDVSFPLLIRGDNHCRGNQLWYVEDSAHLPSLNMSDKYYIKYIPKESEYRIHCVKEGDDVVVLRRQRRVHRSPNYHSIKWNQEYGWGLCPVDTAPGRVVGAAKRALLRLGYDFGAVDVMLKGDKAYVIEVNSAPGLNDTTLSLYGDYILGRLYG